MLGKLRDYYILLHLAQHRDTDYKGFLEFESTIDLKRNGIKISKNELHLINFKRKRKASAIACFYLKSNTAHNTNKVLSARKLVKEKLNQDIDSLNPENITKSIGLKLGKCFLLEICKFEILQNRLLLQTSYKLNNDYIVGAFMGDGSFEVYLKLKFI